jgi:uncharacterized protein YicC (UPF0701 family)
LEKTSKNTEKRNIIRIKIRDNQEPEQALFSKEDIRRFVTEFVSSWIRGDIRIRFPTAAELSKKAPLAIAFPTDPSVESELKIKEHYVDLLSVCAGIKPATPEELEKAITDTFRMLLMFRSANRIEGKILSSDLEKRIDELERNARSTSTLVEQITGHLFKPKETKAAKKSKQE